MPKTSTYRRARVGTAARIALGVALFAVTATLLLPVRAAAAPPWWVRAGLAGMPITVVQASGSQVLVRTATGETLRSSDSAETFARVPGDPALSPPAVLQSGQDLWRVDSSGQVLHAHRNGPFRPDPGSPDLGAGDHPLAAPAALPGVVVTVAENGTVWRRAQDGGWGVALLLLPQSLVAGAPRVTAVAAFTSPLTDTVYLSTDGYSVLISADGGDDWIRANPGLPDSVFSLAADDSAHSVLAATSDGLYVHHLQALPAPASYSDSALLLRWLGIGLVALLSSVLAAVLLARLIAAPPATRSG